MTLQNDDNVLYIDYDVFAFHSPTEIFDSLRTGSLTPLYNRESPSAPPDSEMHKVAQKLNLEVPNGFNSGLLWLPRGCLSITTYCEFIRESDWSATNYFADQTMLAALFEESGATALSEERYVTSKARQFYWEQDVDYSFIAARHFVYPVRHLLFKKGIPLLLADVPIN